MLGLPIISHQETYAATTLRSVIAEEGPVLSDPEQPTLGIFQWREAYKLGNNLKKLPSPKHIWRPQMRCVLQCPKCGFPLIFANLKGSLHYFCANCGCKVVFQLDSKGRYIITKD